MILLQITKVLPRQQTNESKENREKQHADDEPFAGSSDGGTQGRSRGGRMLVVKHYHDKNRQPDSK